jgi:hypothetical protein
VAAAFVPTIVEENVNMDVIESLQRKELYLDDSEDETKAQISSAEKMKRAFEKGKELDKQNAVESGEYRKPTDKQ